MLEKDYKKLYRIQDKVLQWWKTLNLPFYLTGGTALGRFYLQHRFSEDLDFFTNDNSEYKQYIKFINRELKKSFPVDEEKTLVYDDYSRFYISHDNFLLKIEFVNDVKYRFGNTKKTYFGEIDTPANILSNKISSIINRDEAKDIYDIIYISLNYRFNWREIFFDAKKKAVINEIDVEKRIKNFPVDWLLNVDGFKKQSDVDFYQKYLNRIADDFILGKDNSLCSTGVNILDAEPIAGKK